MLGELCLMGELFLMFFFFWRYCKRKTLEQKYRKKISFLDAGIQWLLEVTWKKKLFRMKKEKLDKLKKIYIGKDEETIYHSHYGKLGRAYAIILFLGLFLASASVMIHQKPYLFGNYFLEREDAGGQNRKYSIQADSGTEKKKLTVQIPTRKYTTEEEKSTLKAAKKQLEQIYLGENTSPQRVVKPLRFVKKISGYEVSIRWVIPLGSPVLEDGSLENLELKSAEQTEIKAVLTCGKSEDIFAKTIFVCPAENKKRSFWEKWQEAYQKSEKNSDTEKYVKLPVTVDGKQMRYEEDTISYTSLILFFFILLCIMLPMIAESRLKNHLNKRREQLLLDYPEFIEHFVLLIGAGLNIKGAWEKIVKEYQKRTVSSTERFVYEEMAVTIREIENGVNEAKAYEMFGRRTELLPYMKFCTLLVQNLKKGSSDLLQLLEYEMVDSFQARKENAKTLGEKAGTKLLLPMGMMLVIVFILILYAAFQNM